MSSTEFEPPIPAIKRLQSLALDRTDIWIGDSSVTAAKPKAL